MASDKRQYDVFKGLLSGKQKNTLSADLLLAEVQSNSIASLQASNQVYILHDPCDIRKPASSNMEHLGTVLSLSKQTVSGYRSMNSVAVDMNERSVNLLNHTLYSTAQPNYLSQSSIAKISKQDQATKELFESGNYINTKILYHQQISKSSQLLKQANQEVKLCHVSDREFDDQESFEYIDQLGDQFITRLKLSRLSNEAIISYTPKGKISKKKRFKKLVDKQFAHQASYQIDKLTIKSKTYHQVTCQLEWEKLTLDEKTYTVVRVTLSQAGKPLFEHPMILLTNQDVTNPEDAKLIYRAYLLRFKIEVVFKFIKQNLGWESFQIRDFEAIKNLLAVAFFLVGYFKELEEQLKVHPLAQMLCQLANSKGKVTLFFLLKGLEKLVHFKQVSQWMDQYDISVEQIDQLITQLKGQK